MIDTFTAIDFETAHPKPWSICQIGLVRICGGEVFARISQLIRPPDNYYWYNFIRIHGIKPEHTSNAPTFGEIWSFIEPYIAGQHVIAHNGFGFDFNCLKQTLNYYHLEAPEYHKHCTLKIYRKGLASLCSTYNIPLNHHDALSDAMACAHLFSMNQGFKINE